MECNLHANTGNVTCSGASSSSIATRRTRSRSSCAGTASWRLGRHRSVVPTTGSFPTKHIRETLANTGNSVPTTRVLDIIIALQGVQLLQQSILQNLRRAESADAHTVGQRAMLGLGDITSQERVFAGKLGGGVEFS